MRTCILCRKPFFSRHIGKPHLPPLRPRPPTGVRVMSKSNIISLRTRMEISEYFLQIGGESYRVRRAVESDTNGGGFVMIYESAGQPVLVFSARYPDEHVGQLIVAWRTGFRQGLERGRSSEEVK